MSTTSKMALGELKIALNDLRKKEYFDTTRLLELVDTISPDFYNKKPDLINQIIKDCQTANQWIQLNSELSQLLTHLLHELVAFNLVKDLTSALTTLFNAPYVRSIVESQSLVKTVSLAKAICNQLPEADASTIFNHSDKFGEFTSGFDHWNKYCHLMLPWVESRQLLIVKSYLGELREIINQ